MGRGRKPIPTKEKLERNIRLDRETSNIILHDQSESVPTPPEHFSDNATAIYYRLASYLHTKGLLFDTDIDLLFGYAYNAAANREAQEKLREVEPTSKESYYWLKVHNESLTFMLRIGANFGFNPADKNKITVPAGAKERKKSMEQNLDDYFNKD